MVDEKREVFMKLSKYLLPMTNLPDRFSNLAFWRSVRKLKSNIVATFNYIESWGNNVENVLRNLNRSFGHDNFHIQLWSLNQTN